MLKADRSESNPKRYIENFSHTAMFGKPVGISIAWNSQNRVTTSVGAMEQHDMQMRSPPNYAGLSMAAGSVRFENTALLCFPDSAR